MKILFLSHYFPPEVNAPATRTYEHCKHWVRMGHDVTVISCVPHHPHGRAFPGYRNSLYQVEHKDGIRAVKVLTYITANEGFLKRTFNYVFYMFMAVLASLREQRPDVVISTSPQFFNGLAGYFVSRLKRAPWVLEIRDLWPESIVAVGALQSNKLVAALEWLERFVYQKADHIVPVSQPFAEHIERQAGRTEDVTVITNGVNLELYTHRDRDVQYEQSLGVEGKFVAAYVGTHGMAHGLDTLLDAAERLQQEPDITFLMAGDGAERERLEQEISKRHLQNVRMLGQLPKEDMPLLWSCTDVSLVLLRNLELFRTVIPSKIFESMGMKKPVVLGVRGESERIVRESGGGICIEPENADELAEVILRLARNRDLGRELGESGFRHVSEQFDRSVLADRFADLLQRVCSDRA